MQQLLNLESRRAEPPALEPGYQQLYGFKESPFSLTPDPKFFYQGESHIRAFELLRLGILRGEGFMVVTGDIGTGKTTLCRAVLENVQENVYTAVLLNPSLSETDLLRAILQDFGVMSPYAPAEDQTISKHDLITKLNDFLLSILTLGSRAMILVDEAQNIPVATLEQIRILSNLETPKEKLLQIVLVGQSELKNVLARPELRQLDQRISIRCELMPLSQTETGKYIDHRLSIASAGPAGVNFGADAIKVIYQYSGGIPRLINLIGDRCLTAGSAGQNRTINKSIARQAVKSLAMRKTRPPRQSPDGEPRWWVHATRIAIVLGLVVLLSGLLLWMFDPGLLTRVLGRTLP